MGLLQKAVETYDANIKLIGIYLENKEPLAPIAHTLTSANIEITLDTQGNLVSARKVDKKEPKILIPITEKSGGRTSSPAAHPLCDQLKYVAPNRKQEHTLYLEQLTEWQESGYSHVFLKPILRYVEKGKIIADLENRGVIVPEKNGKYDEKLLVCWRVIGFDNEDPACWRNQGLFQSHIDHYLDMMSTRQSCLCMIDGVETSAAEQHPKGIIAVNGNAKLVSANDTSGFTFRGRFNEEWQAATVGYIASQKAHNALRWLASDQGVREFSGNRVFICWSPEGIQLPKPARRHRKDDSEPKYRPSDYRKALRNTLLSFRKDSQIDGSETAIVAAFDAATTGRLAVTYYNEYSIDLFLERIQTWDEYCCWYSGKYGIQAASLLQIIECAVGVQRGNFLETDDKVEKQLLQRLLDCKVGGGIFPFDILKALVNRASMPMAFDSKIWRKIVFTTCAAIQKYRYDTKKGGDEMAWELGKKDRSFQYGRLLAVMERAEEDYYYKSNESRQTNAIKFMSEYRQRPFFVFERVNRLLHQAYLPRIEKWQSNRYERLTGEIFEIIREYPEEELNRPLSEVYLMGYELQRNEFFKKQESKEDNYETEEK